MAGNAQNVCTLDTSNVQVGITPNDTNAPPVIRGVLFDTVAQIYVPTTYSINYGGSNYTANIIWLNIDSVNGFPTGITYARNPGVSDTIYGGGRQCIRLSGTTMDTVGTYNLNFFGHIHITALGGFIDTTVSLARAATLFGYFLKVDGGVGIHDIGGNFNSSLNVYPNPGNGSFNVSLSNIGSVDGEIVVMDMTGRRVYSQKVETAGSFVTSIDLSHFSKGIYTVQVRTENGFAAKNISIE